MLSSHFLSVLCQLLLPLIFLMNLYRFSLFVAQQKFFRYLVLSNLKDASLKLLETREA